MWKDVYSSIVNYSIDDYIFLPVYSVPPFTFIHEFILVKSLIAVNTRDVEKPSGILVVWLVIGGHIQENVHINVKIPHVRRHSLDERH
jgi:hypothetical protein